MNNEEMYYSLSEYLLHSGVKIVESFDDKYLDGLKELNTDRVLEQLFIIKDFHNKALGYKSYIHQRLDNKTGKTVEQYKVSIRKLKRYFKNLQNKSPENSFEEYMLYMGEYYIERADKCISQIFSSGYMDILNRSMKRGEICLGNTDFTNIRKRDYIEIKSLDECCYNTIEMDGFCFLNKLQKKELGLDIYELINRFCEIEELDENSQRFISALMAYPGNFIRCCHRYRENKKDWSIEQYKARLEKAMLKDEEFTI